MTGPRPPSGAAMVRLVAAREASSRLRDKNFVIGSIVIVVVLVAIMGFQVAANSSGVEETRVGALADELPVAVALEVQSRALGVDVTVQQFPDEAAARRALTAGDVDGVLLGGSTDEPRLLVASSAGGQLLTVAQSATSQVAVAEQLEGAGVQLQPPPEVRVEALDPQVDATGQRTAVALVGTVLLYGLLILFAQFVAQGVVEEKSSRVVELLLATMKPWQLLAGKILGLGVLGLAQILVITALGLTGALAFDLVDVPGDVVGTAVAVLLWFVVGYGFYAALFAAAASLVSRQEDLGSVLTPTSLLLVAAFVIAVQAGADPGGSTATVTSFVPGLSPMVMPVRAAAGEAAPWEVAVAVLLMLVAIAAVVRVGGRIYAGALLRTSGKVKLREALRAGRA